MIERIKENEERLNSIIISIKKLEDAIEEFNKNKDNIKLLNKYYGSRKWFKDKEAYENNKIPKIKAGVLSEDTVWNMLEDIDNLILEMNLIVKNYNKKNI